MITFNQLIPFTSRVVAHFLIDTHTDVKIYVALTNL